MTKADAKRLKSGDIVMYEGQAFIFTGLYGWTVFARPVKNPKGLPVARDYEEFELPTELEKALL